MNILEILKDNNLKNVVLINKEHIKFDLLPNVWKEIILETNNEQKKKIILNYWNSFKEKLSKIYQILSNDLINVCVIEHNKKIKMIYIFDSNGDIITYQGELPCKNSSFLAKMPQEIAIFYQQIHNGWNDTINGALGFVSIENIKYLDELEWGILEKIDIPEIDLKNTYYIFHNGAGGYICINNFDRNYQYLIWWKDEKPEYNINFWSYFDAWVQINFGYKEL